MPLPYFDRLKLSPLGASILLLGSASTLSRAQDSAPVAMNVPVQTSTAHDAPALPLKNNVASPDTVAAAVQVADNARQLAEQQLHQLNTEARVDQPNVHSDHQVDEQVSEVASQAALADTDENPPNTAQAGDVVNTEEHDARAELEQARDAAQYASSDAAIAQAQPAEREKSDREESDKAEQQDNWLQRMWYRIRPKQEELAAALPTISVEVEGAPELLEKNIAAKLSQYTVEAFEDFRASLAQLRSMSKVASEAVGYYDAEFRFEKIDDDTLHVQVTPNDPVLVSSQRIQFEGAANQDPRFKRIKKNLVLKVGDRLNDQQYEATKASITAAGTEKGYFDAYWKMHDVRVTLPDNTADIKLNYHSGERYKLGDVVFKNTNPDQPLPVDMKLLKQLVPFTAGEKYAAWKVNNLSKNLSDTRYFSSLQVDTVIPDPVEKALELPADVQAVQQAQALREQAQASQAPTSADDSPQQNIVDESQFAGTADSVPSALSRSMNKELSEAEQREQEKQQQAQQARETKTIPVIVSINADKPNSAEAGIGYGTDTGVRLRSQYRKALVNSHGHNVEGNFEVSQIRQAIDMRYNLPYKHPLEDTLSVFGGFEQEKKGTIGDSLGLSTQSMTVGAERAIKPKNGDWQHTMSVRYRLDQLKRETNSNTAQKDLPPPFNINNSRFEQQSLLLGYGINKIYTRGSKLDPTHAFRQFYQVEVGSKSVLTDTDLAILRAGWRFIYSFGQENNHQLVGRIDAATILTKDFENVPYNLRFFAGGDQSIRGYDYKSLSTLDNGYLIGGQNLAVSSLEYNYRFVPKWRAAVFVDGGNAFDEKFNDPVKLGAGVGLRWSSPVGPIRIDVAAGVSETSMPIRLHFFIGPQL